MVSPALATPLGATTVSFRVGVFVKTIAGAEVRVVVWVSGSVTFGPLGGVPVTVAVLAREPASISACVNVYTLFVAVQLALAPGARLASVHVSVGSNGSVTVMPVSVTFPVFWIEKV